MIEDVSSSDAGGCKWLNASKLSDIQKLQIVGSLKTHKFGSQLLSLSPYVFYFLSLSGLFEAWANETSSLSTTNRNGYLTLLCTIVCIIVGTYMYNCRYIYIYTLIHQFKMNALINFRFTFSWHLNWRHQWQNSTFTRTLRGRWASTGIENE